MEILGTSHSSGQDIGCLLYMFLHTILVLILPRSESIINSAAWPYAQVYKLEKRVPPSMNQAISDEGLWERPLGF